MEDLSKYISVAEMGEMLGLKKTERYRLLHQYDFETVVAGRRTCIVRKSFEDWYANQEKYRKVNGEPPGKELRKYSYSVRDIAQILDLSESAVYDIIKKDKIPTITVEGKWRITVEEFKEWYVSQERYRTAEDRMKDKEAEDSSLSLPEAARLLGITRNTLYMILKEGKYRHLFDIIYVAGRKRITKESFNKFLQAQDQYRTRFGKWHGDLNRNNTGSVVQQNKNVEAPNDVTYLTRKMAAEIADVSESTIFRWAEEGRFPELTVGKFVRIPKKEFMDWLDMRRREEEQNGID